VPSAAVASEPHAAQVAREVLRKGNAVDAVVAGVLAAAAESPAVLLGPVQLLAGGAGAGLLAVDGRTLQPGRGAPRPRGFLSDEEVPAAASVGAPVLLAALTAAHASLGSATLHRVCAPALAIANERSPERARVLAAFARRGPPALAEDLIATELLVAAGRAARGLLTLDDLAAGSPTVTRVKEQALDSTGVCRVPWRGQDAPDGSATHVVAAADTRGLVSVACYEAPLDGVPVPGLGLVAPRSADPVMRGRRRVAPGVSRAAAAPIALRSARGGVDLAMGVATDGRAESRLDELVAALTAGATAAEAIHRVASGRPLVLVRTPDGARAFG
jgi:hypothetical protein